MFLYSIQIQNLRPLFFPCLVTSTLQIYSQVLQDEALFMKPFLQNSAFLLVYQSSFLCQH